MGTHVELDSTDWLTASVRDREEQNPTEKVGGRSYRLKPMWTERWELVEMLASLKGSKDDIAPEADMGSRAFRVV